MRKWVFSFLLVLGACASNDVLNRVCPTECFPEWMTEEMRGVGVCTSGEPVCDDSNKLIDCIYDKEASGYQWSEVCDGLDNDCDGYVDEWIHDRQSQYFVNDEDNACLKQFGSKIGECAHILVVCRNGQYVCNIDEEWLDIEVGEETLCDLKDNNCNGRIDDIELRCTDLQGNEVACFCYEGPFGTERHGICDEGYYECVDGNIICVGQVLPSIELCDSIDNDCNGIIDDTGDTLDNRYDIVFIIDTSGSMCSYIAAVAGALDAYVEQFENNPNFRFAIVIMSSNGLNLITLDTDFTDLGTIRSRLLSLGCSGSGIEGSLDSMKMVCDEANPLGLSWISDSNKLFFAFTDEPAQSYTAPVTTVQDVIDSCLVSGTLPFIWSRSPAFFQNITAGANGIYFMLENTWQPIFDDLNSIVITLCGS